MWRILDTKEIIRSVLRAVVKTSMIKAITGNNIQKTYVPSSENKRYTQDLTLGHYKIRLHLWDLPGEDNYRTSSSSQYSNADAAIIAYNMADYVSLYNVRSWSANIDLILPIDTSRSLQKIVIGLKRDSTHACVTKEDGEAVAADLMCQHFTGSCYEKGAFDDMLRRLVISMCTEHKRVANEKNIVLATTPLLVDEHTKYGNVAAEKYEGSPSGLCAPCVVL